jgi:hypothetical protein
MIALKSDSVEKRWKKSENMVIRVGARAQSQKEEGQVWMELHHPGQSARQAKAAKATATLEETHCGKDCLQGLRSRRKETRRRTDAEVIAWGQQKRAERLANRTRAEIRFAEILDDLRIVYESEAIIQNGDRVVLIDFLIRMRKIAFEIDGSSHDRTKRYDAGRDKWLWYWHGIKVYRFSN